MTSIQMWLADITGTRTVLDKVRDMAQVFAKPLGGLHESAQELRPLTGEPLASPIEEAFLHAWRLLHKTSVLRRAGGSSTLLVKHDGQQLAYDINETLSERALFGPHSLNDTIECQSRVGGYYTDFRIERDICAGGDCPPVPLRPLIVEVDGRDFHDREVYQLKRDRLRDRECQLAGNAVFRFTGSEVFSDPIGCAAKANIWLERQEQAAIATGKKLKQDHRDLRLRVMNGDCKAILDACDRYNYSDTDNRQEASRAYKAAVETLVSRTSMRGVVIHMEGT